MILAFFFLTVLLSGCEQSSHERQYTEITSENIQDKEESLSAQIKEFAWILPEAWTEKPGMGMRLASFYLSSDEEAIDCSIVSLSGVAGGLEPNLIRWMGQIGLDSTEGLETLIKSAVDLKIKGGQIAQVFDFTIIQSKAKPTDKSMIAVMIVMDETTLFVKMTGTIEAVLKNKKSLLELAWSIEAIKG